MDKNEEESFLCAALRPPRLKFLWEVVLVNLRSVEIVENFPIFSTAEDAEEHRGRD